MSELKTETRRRRALAYFGLVADPRDRDRDSAKTSIGYLVGLVTVIVIANVAIDSLGLSWWEQVVAFLGVGVVVGTVVGLVLRSVRASRRRPR